MIRDELTRGAKLLSLSRWKTLDDVDSVVVAVVDKTEDPRTPQTEDLGSDS